MKKFIQNKLKDQKGLTLIELLAVIVILAIIAAIAIPAIGNIIENSRYSAVKSDASNAMAAANIYYTENPEDSDNSVTISELKSQGFLESVGKLVNTNTIANTSDGLKLTTGAISYSGTRSVEFAAATQQQITGDNQTGSANPTAKKIGTGATTDSE